MSDGRPAAQLIRFGDIEADLRAGEVRRHGGRTVLPDQPLRILVCLIERAGEVVTRDELRKELWPDNTFVDFEHGLNSAIKRLRDALGDSAETPRFIETVPRRGYRFIAKIDTPVPLGTPSPESEGRPTVPPRWGTPRLLWIGLGAGLLIGAMVIAVAGSRAYWQGNDRESTSPPADAGSRASASDDLGSNRVAVARFENRTGDASLDPLGRLAAERVIRLAAGLNGIEVVPQPFDLAGGPSGGSASTPGAPDASVLVAGSYYAQGEGLEFQARILDASSGRLLHGIEPLTGVRSRPADLLQRLEQKVAGAVAIHFDDFFGGLSIVSHPPTLDAYRDYRVGLEIFHSDYPRSLTHLERASDTDPTFLLPLAIMHFAYGNLGRFEDSESVLARMESQSDRVSPAERLLIEFLRANLEGRRAQALRVLDDLERLAPESLLVNFNIVQHSLVLNRPWAAIDAFARRPSSERSLRHSIGGYRLNLLATALHMIGAYERELEEVRLAQEYAPGVLSFLLAEARALTALGRVSDATRVIDRSLSVAPTAGWQITPGRVMEQAARELRAHGHREDSQHLAERGVDWYHTRPADAAARREHREGLAFALYLAERWEEARPLFSTLAAEDPGEVAYMAYLGQIAARMGDTASARAISNKLERITGGRAGAEATYGRTRIAALLGERQRAVELLRDALTQGFPQGLHIHNSPDFETLRDYEPFLELVRPKH